MPLVKYKLFYKTNNKKHNTLIEKADMNIIKQYFSNSLEDLIKLQEFVWFNLCFHFGRRRQKIWREIKKEHFKIMIDAKNLRCHNYFDQDYQKQSFWIKTELSRLK